MAKVVADAIVRHGKRPFDQAWMDRTFSNFWASSGVFATRLSNALPSPPAAAVNVLRATANNPAVGDAFMQSAWVLSVARE
ncbi:MULTISPECIES: hypothetical protein [unclassified Sphingobium]|uniref:hypothetical protein n=1 Tax=unclassified Sphingobium TaxID=2611147 RepID=UPI00128FF781|nr:MULTISPECIES: hypothetical protein [unclassified Sphingobium]